MLDADQIVQLANATELKVNECLSNSGYEATFQYPEDEQVQSFSELIIDDRRSRGDIWGFFDPDNAAQFGYQRPHATLSIVVAPLPQGAEELCGSLITGDEDPLLRSSYMSLPGGGPDIAQSPRITTIMTDWSACMHAAGYSYTSPLDPLQEFVEETTPSERQIQTAIRDIQCKSDTNLIAAVLDEQVVIDEAYIDDHEAELQEIAELKQSLTSE